MHAHYINKIGEHVGETVTIKGWLHNRRSSGKIHFLVVRDGTGFLQVVMGKQRRRRSDVPDGRSPEPGERRSSSPARCRPRSARERRLRDDRQRPRGRQRGARLSDHAEGARRRLPDGSPPPVDPRRAADRDPARAPRDHQRRPRLLQRRRASSSPTRRSSRRPRAKARRRCSRSSTSTTRRPI